MEKIGNNGGVHSQLSSYETPFADAGLTQEEPQQHQQLENFNFQFLNETDSPFKLTFEIGVGDASTVTESAEAFTELLAELNDSEFETTLFNLAAEAEDTYSSKISNETAMGDQYIPYATQQIKKYMDPLAQETERVLDKISDYFSGNNLTDQTESQIDQLFEQFETEHTSLSPAQEQFLGSLIKKAKSVVNAGIKLAKKGISAVGKILPINIILDKLKKLVRPLLDKVLKFAINKLPKTLQPHAHTLAKKFLNLETASAEQSDETQNPASGELEAIQYELDSNIANLMFSQDESQSEDLVQNYLHSSEMFEREEAYETGGINLPSLQTARQRFINDLKNLRQGESPVPAIENFLPAAILAAQPIIKMAITVIGRPKVINFLAGLLAKLVAKYIPPEAAKPLASKIIDVGMAAIGFETYETDRSDLAYEAIANTIEETIQNMGSLDESLLDDQENFTSLALESFESAAVNNFPASYIKESVRKTRQTGLWVLMPRSGPGHYYKKFTHVFPITIEPASANSILSFKGVPLSNFLRDKLGLDPSKPIQARVHLYETIEGTRLNRISRSENVPGLGASQPYGWVQFHPLSVNAASLLLKEPGLGKDFSEEHTKSRHRPAKGQRLFYLEINGARLRLPVIHPKKKSEVSEKQAGRAVVPRSTDIQGVINFVRSEIKFNYYFSEEDAKSIVEKLNQNDYMGVSITVRNSVKKILNELLIKNAGHKVKIVHEAMPEMYVDNVPEENFAPWESVKSMVLNTGKSILKKLIQKIIARISEPAYKSVLNYFKTRAAEFKQAQSLPNDGVTVKIIWLNVPGMSAIRAVIKAIRGNLSLGKITDLSIPNIPVPEVKIAAGKVFD